MGQTGGRDGALPTILGPVLWQIGENGGRATLRVSTDANVADLDQRHDVSVDRYIALELSGDGSKRLHKVLNRFAGEPADRGERRRFAGRLAAPSDFDRDHLDRRAEKPFRHGHVVVEVVLNVKTRTGLVRIEDADFNHGFDVQY